MKFLVDRCAGRLLAEWLLNQGHDVLEARAWLDTAHRRLDEAVFNAYGWPPNLSDDEVLARLLALNQERAAAHG